MHTFKELTEFVESRRPVYAQVEKDEENMMPYHWYKQMKQKKAYEDEGRSISQMTRNLFDDTGLLYMALSELYTFGETVGFPGIYMDVNHAKAAYWLLRAFGQGNKKAFLFAHSLVPEFFIKDQTQEMVEQVIGKVLDILSMCVCHDTQEDYMKTHAVGCFIANLMIQSPCDIGEQIQHVLCALDDIEGRAAQSYGSLYGQVANNWTRFSKKEIVLNSEIF